MKGKGPIVVVVFSLLIAAIMGLVSMLPKTVESESQYSYSNSKEEIISYLSTSENWKNWLFYVPKSQMKFIQNGPQKGEGAGFKWFNKKEGDGVIEIKSVLENRVTYELVTDNGQYRDRGSFVFMEMDGKTSVVWQDTLDVSTNLLARWAANDESFSKRINAKNLSTLIKIDSLINLNN